jgi:hypothetical protein
VKYVERRDGGREAMEQQGKIYKGETSGRDIGGETEGRDKDEETEGKRQR